MKHLAPYLAIATAMGFDFKKMAKASTREDVCEICMGNGTIVGSMDYACGACDGKGYYGEDEEV